MEWWEWIFTGIAIYYGAGLLFAFLFILLFIVIAWKISK